MRKFILIGALASATLAFSGCSEADIVEEFESAGEVDTADDRGDITREEANAYYGIEPTASQAAQVAAGNAMLATMTDEEKLAYFESLPK